MIIAALAVSAALAAAPEATAKKPDVALQQIDQQIAKAAVDKNNSSWKMHLPKPEVATFDPARTYYAIMETSKGSIKIKLMPDVAPMHVTSTMSGVNLRATLARPGSDVASGSRKSARESNEVIPVIRPRHTCPSRSPRRPRTANGSNTSTS